MDIELVTDPDACMIIVAASRLQVVNTNRLTVEIWLYTRQRR